MKPLMDSNGANQQGGPVGRQQPADKTVKCGDKHLTS